MPGSDSGPTTKRLSNGLLSAEITNFGASLTDLRLAGVGHSLVLGFPDLADQVEDGQYMGAVIGRYANRIAGGRVRRGDKVLCLETNENGVGHLHGGSAGFGTAIWRFDHYSSTALELLLDSPDGASGYPGNLSAVARYELFEPATLRLTLSARCDRDTIVNLCHHPYFNLDGRPDVSQHRLCIKADHYLPSDSTLIPTGGIAPVTGTRFDFREEAGLADGVTYNNTYCLHRRQIGPLTQYASLQAGPVRMVLATTQPGLHLYDGYKIKPSGIGHGGVRYRARAGLCLEAQAWPDSPNNSDFPDVWLDRGRLYRQITEYRFGVEVR